jgi:hypothetical protein
MVVDQSNVGPAPEWWRFAHSHLKFEISIYLLEGDHFMKNCLITNFVAVFLTLAAAADNRALAQFPPATPIEGQAGKATLGERPSFGGNTSQSIDFSGTNGLPVSGVEYLIDVLSDDEIHAFAVSSNSFGPTSSIFLNWNAAVIEAANWGTYSFELGGPGGTTVQTADLPDFGELFGTDLRAVLFYRGAGGVPITDVVSDDDMASWDTTPARFFYGNSLPVSEFIVLNGAGNLLDASNTLVPEPSSLALAVMSVLGIAAVQRRRRSRNGNGRQH